jgi:CubicO group peptidase (beta-lactamase class C family)
MLLPVAPAGALWSNAHDMALYMITELNEGISPNGERVVSAENLKKTWEPQVEITANIRYGLGWMVDEYHGLQMIQHGGNTWGFTTDFVFLPEARLGIVVMSNARLANVFAEGVRRKLLSVVFEQESEYDKTIDYVLEQDEEGKKKLEQQLQGGYDASAVAPYLGTFSNTILGDILLAEQDGKLMLDAGEFTTELRVRVNDKGETEYVTVDPPYPDLSFEFVEEDSQPVIRLDMLTDVYTFE